MGNPRLARSGHLQAPRYTRWRRPLAGTETEDQAEEAHQEEVAHQEVAAGQAEQASAHHLA